MAVSGAWVAAAKTAPVPTSAYAPGEPVDSGQIVWTTIPTTPPSMAPM